MCQLTLSHLGSSQRNSLFIYSQLLQNSLKGNNDGTGFFCPNGGNNKEKYVKTGLDAQVISNLGILFREVVLDNSPVIGHVRQATTHANVKTISDDSAHPFLENKIVLMHNGVLEAKNKETLSLFNTTTDSELFTKILNSEYDGTNFVEAFQKTLNLFYGTFAFLIYARLENSFYVVRGKTKKLHIQKVKVGDQPGFVINTDSADLVKGIVKFNALNTIVEGLVTEKIENYSEIKAETIFKVNNLELEEVGKAEETTKPIANVENSFRNNLGGHFSNSGVDEETKKNVDIILKFMDDLYLSFGELDLLFFSATGMGLLESSVNDIVKTLEFIYPKLKNFVTEGKKAVWEELVLEFNNIPENIYRFYPTLDFPYMINSRATLENLRRSLNASKTV